MSNELAIVNGGPSGGNIAHRPATVMSHLVPQTISEAAQLANAFCRARLFKLQSEEQALTILLTGMELGLAPATAMRGIHIIEGKPSLSADLMVAVCRARRDICESFDVLELTSEIATVRTKRVGASQPVEMSFTWKDAEKAGLTGKDNWRKFPSQMLLARAKAKLARAVYEDLVMGLYTPDEVSSGDAADPDDLIVSEYQREAQQAAEQRAREINEAREALVAALRGHKHREQWRDEAERRGGTRNFARLSAEQMRQMVEEIERGDMPWEPVVIEATAPAQDAAAELMDDIREKAGVPKRTPMQTLNKRIAGLRAQANLTDDYDYTEWLKAKNLELPEPATPQDLEFVVLALEAEIRDPFADSEAAGQQSLEVPA